MPSNRICDHCGTEKIYAFHCPCGGATYCHEGCQGREWEKHKELCTVHLSEQVNKHEMRTKGLTRYSISEMLAETSCTEYTTEHYMKSLFSFEKLLMRLADARFDREECTPAKKLWDEVLEWDKLRPRSVDSDNFVSIHAMVGHAKFWFWKGEYGYARRNYEIVHNAFMSMGDRATGAEMVRMVGNCRMHEGDDAGAILKFQEAMNSLEDVSDPPAYVALVQSSLGFAFNSTDPIKAMDLLQSALAFFRTAGPASSLHLTQCLENVAGIHLGLGQFDLALACLHEALPIHRRINRRYSPRTAVVFMRFGYIYDAQENVVEANKSYQKARRYIRRWNAQVSPQEDFVVLPEDAVSRRRFGPGILLRPGFLT
jgi:tetratricopeptide (TPR) repeat protein